MNDETFIEMEKAAKALDLSDVHTAAICLRKAMEGHITMRPPEASPSANAVDPKAELSKAINSLEVGDFSVAALCTEKAAASLKDQIPAELRTSLMEAARDVRAQEFSSAASAVRNIVRYYRPDLTLAPPAPMPKVGVAASGPVAPQF